MEMEMVLVLVVVLMETPEGDGEYLRRRFRRRFLPPIFSGGSLLSSISGFVIFRRLPLENIGGLFI